MKLLTIFERGTLHFQLSVSPTNHVVGSGRLYGLKSPLYRKSLLIPDLAEMAFSFKNDLYLFYFRRCWLLLPRELCSGCGERQCSRALAHGSRVHRLRQWQLGAQQLWLSGSRAQTQQLWRTGSVASWRVRSSRTGDQNCVSCTGRQTPHHWSTRETLILLS